MNAMGFVSAVKPHDRIRLCRRQRSGSQRHVQDSSPEDASRHGAARLEKTLTLTVGAATS